METFTRTYKQLEFQITAIIKLSNACELNMLKDIEEQYKNAYFSYESIGILDGNPIYYNKLADKKAYYNRVKAIRNLVEVLQETDKDIIRE